MLSVKAMELALLPHAEMEREPTRLHLELKDLGLLLNQMDQ